VDRSTDESFIGPVLLIPPDFVCPGIHLAVLKGLMRTELQMENTFTI